MTALVNLVLTTTLLAVPQTDAPLAATATKETLMLAVSHNWDRIDSLVVEYASRHVSDERDGLHTILTVKGARRMVQSAHDNLTAADDPRSWHQILTHDEWNVFLPHWRRYEVSRRFAIPPYTDKITSHMFFGATAWWPKGSEASPLRLQNGKSYFLHDVLRDPAYAIAPRQKTVAGVPCHVVERAGEDRLWIDASRGLLFRRHCFSKGSPEPEVTYELRDYREEAPDIWLPYEIERHHRGLAHHVVHRVKSYRVNDVDDAAFNFVPPPGTVVHDRDTDRIEQIPGGFEFFEELISRAQSHIEPRRAHFPWADAFLPGLFGFGLAGATTAWHARTRRRCIDSRT